ncbi:YncE family protein [Lutibacter holmesii]|uniref:YncE family protein n=1 Tax=Lutibacter holmesii TaxID=1137985 RepID=A0ABW3WNP6_9FLAO
MKISKFLLSIFLLSVLFVSCDDDDEPQLPKGDYENGIIISGEGVATGSVYFVSDDYVTTESLIYKNVNGADLGVYLQSISFDDDYAYIIVDNQNTIVVVDRYTFEYVGEITTDLILPRYMVIEDGIGYATNWGSTYDATDDFVAVIDLDAFEVTSTIPVGNGPERIVEENGKLYVSHKGAWSTNNIVTVIDIDTQATSEITVGDNPDELFVNNSGDLVVLSEGRTIYDENWNWLGQTDAVITTIDTNSDTVSSELAFPSGSNPSLMVEDDSYIYYNLGSSIYKMDVSATSLPTTALLETEAAYLYGLEVEDDSVYTLDANFSGESKMNVFSLSTGAKTNTTAAPVGASKIYFN